MQRLQTRRCSASQRRMRSTSSEQPNGPPLTQSRREAAPKLEKKKKRIRHELLLVPLKTYFWLLEYLSMDGGAHGALLALPPQMRASRIPTICASSGGLNHSKGYPECTKPSTFTLDAICMIFRLFILSSTALYILSFSSFRRPRPSFYALLTSFL